MTRLRRREFLTATTAAGVVGVRPLTAQPQELVVGTMHAVTGNYAFVGGPTTDGIILASEELNASDFFAPNKLRLIVEDTASDRNQAITLINRFATRDDALIVLGPTSSFAALATAPAANQLEMPMISTATSTEVLAVGPWSFKITQPAEVPMVALAQYAVDTLGIQRVVAVFIRENDGYVRQKNAFLDFARERGVTILSEESVLISDSDFTAQATKIANSGADCLFLSTPAEMGANIIIQARQAGLPDNVRIVTNPSMSTQAFITTGGPMAEGVYLVADFVPGGADEQGRAFVEAFKQKYGRAPDNYAAVGYTKMMVVAQAIQQAAGPNPTRDGVRRALGQIHDFPVILGDGVFSMDAHRVPHFGSVVLTIRNGQFVMPQ